MDSKTWVPEFNKVKMVGLGFLDFMAKFVNYHEKRSSEIQ